MAPLDILAIMSVCAPLLFGVGGYVLGVSDGASIHGEILRGERTKGPLRRFARWCVWGSNKERRF